MLQTAHQRTRNERTVLVVSSAPVALPWRPTGPTERGLHDLRKGGRLIVLVQPAPIHADALTSLIDRVEVTPVTIESMGALVARERPGMVLPLPEDSGARKVVAELRESGLLEAYGVSSQGPRAQRRDQGAEQSFREAMLAAGLSVPPGVEARTWEEAEAALAQLSFPISVRPASTFGSLWGVRCQNLETLRNAFEAAVRVSPVRTARLQQQSTRVDFTLASLGEPAPVASNVILACDLEDLGNRRVKLSRTQPLPHEERVDWRRCLEGVLAELGVATAGSSVQFAIDPYRRRLVALRGIEGDSAEVIWDLLLPPFWQRGWFRACDGRLRDDPSIAIQRDLLQLQPGSRVLDIGAGGGIWTMEMAEAIGPSGSVVATDIDEAAVARVGWEAFRRGLRNVESRLVEQSEIGAADGSADRMLISDVYLFNEGNRAWSRKYLENCARVLSDGGLVLIKHDKLHTTEWKPADGPRREYDDLDAEELLELGRPFFRLDALLPLRSFRPEPGQRHGYMLVLRKA